MIDQKLLEIIRDQYALDWHGIHGLPHWNRVLQNGLALARSTGANVKVVELFAFLHDSRRLNDNCDPEHGPRAAEFAQSLAGRVFELDGSDLELLLVACRDHTKGLTAGDATVLTCWDADRLDLGRVGIRPHPRRLCTAAARHPKMLRWAYERSLTWRVG